MRQSKKKLQDNQYTTFYLVRHGETEWNVKKIIQGQTDSSLTKTGTVQAKNLAKKLKRVYFDKIFSSDLFRAKRTAEIIAAEKRLAVVTTKLLRERAFGKYEGWPIEKYYKNFEKYFVENKRLSDMEAYKRKPDKDIESDEEIVNRLITFIREVAIGYPGKTILVVTHGGIMRGFLIHLGYGTRKELPAGSIENTAYVKLLSDGTDFFIKEVVGVEKKVMVSG